jgi:MFS family permease
MARGTPSSGAASSPDAGFRLSSFVLPFYVPAFIASTGAAMVMPVLPLYARSLGAGIAATGAIVAMFGLGSLLCNIPAGFAIGRFGKKRAMVFSLVAEVSVLIFAGLATNPLSLGIAVFALGGVHSVFFISRLSFFRELVPAAQRGRALALLGGEYRFGSFIGPVVGGFVAASLGYGSAFIGHALASAVVLVCVVLWVPSDPERQPAPDAEVGTGLRFPSVSRIGAILRDNASIFLTAGSSIIILQLVRAGRQVIVPLWGDAIGLDVSQIGLVFGIMFAVETAIVYPAGIIMDRFGRKRAGVPCILILSASLTLLPFTHSFAGLVLVCVLSGLGNGMGSGINMTLSTDYAPTENPGEFLGVWRMVVESGSTLGPVLIGSIADIFTLGASPIVIAAIGLVGVGIMQFGMKETLVHRRR